MSLVIRTAGKVFAKLPPGLALSLMLTFSPLLPWVSQRHRRRFRVLKKLRGPNCTLRFGPFAGLRYFPYAAGSQILPKYAGTYESELVDVFKRIVALKPDLIVDIGSAEGFYVVGLARQLPSARVIAYDINQIANSLCRKLAEVNNVISRVRIAGTCTPAVLERDIQNAQRPVVICDTEGFEDELLLPDETPSLGKAAILVELHDAQRPAVSERVRRRFEKSHDIEVIAEVDRDVSMAPHNLGLSPEERKLAIDEGRQGQKQQWFWMTPR